MYNRGGKCPEKSCVGMKIFARTSVSFAVLHVSHLACVAPACILMTTGSLGAGLDLNTTSLCWATAAGGGGGGTNPAHGGSCTSRLPKCRAIHFHPLSHRV